MKPGYRSSEFILAVGAQLFAILVLLGLISADERATLEKAVTDIFAGVSVVAANVVVLWKYIHARLELKKQAADIQADRLFASVLVSEPTPREGPGGSPGSLMP